MLSAGTYAVLCQSFSTVFHCGTLHPKLIYFDLFCPAMSNDDAVNEQAELPTVTIFAVPSAAGNAAMSNDDAVNELQSGVAWLCRHRPFQGGDGHHACTPSPPPPSAADL